MKKTLNKTTLGVILAAAMLLAVGIPLAGCDQINLGKPATAEATLVPVVTASPNVIAEGRVMPRDYRYLSFNLAGEVREVLVKEGEAVTEGQALARLGETEALDAAVKAADAELLAAQQALDTLNEKAGVLKAQADAAVKTAERAQIEVKKALDDLDTDDFQQRLDDARIAVTDADKELQDAQDEADKYKDLDPDNATRKNAEDVLKTAQTKYNDAVYQRDVLVNQLESAQANLAAAEARLADARLEAEKLASGPDADQTALAQARLDAVQAQLAAAQAGLEKLTLKAPFAGTLVELDLVAGENILPSQRVGLVADLSEWVIETTDLTEIEVVKIEAGRKATLTPDALPELSLGAKVDTISLVYREKGGDIIYTVRLALDERDARLRWGMTVVIKFDE